LGEGIAIEFVCLSAMTGSVDFYGHTGERSVLAFISGQAVIIKDLRAEMFYDKQLGETSP
jgi:hypothetical protein